MVKVKNFETINSASLKYAYTDRNAKIAVANYYNSAEHFGELDWESIKTKNWKSDESNLERRDLKQSEFLIHRHVPKELIACLVVKNQEKKVFFENIINDFGLEIPVYVDNNCKLYY